MTLRLISAAAMMASLCHAQDKPGHLPIDLPKDAQINFEVDAPASQLAPLISQMFSGDNADPASKTIAIKTGLGTINVDSRDLADLLRPIKELHVVSFNGDSKDDAIEHYEHEFANQGMRKVANVSGSNAVLVMRQDGPSGRYLAVMEQGKRVTVIRTDGMPDLGTLGQLALEKLTEAGQRMKKKVKL